MFGIGSTELLVILVVALIVLGPKSLASISRSLGKAMGEFRRVSTDFQRTLNAEVEQEEQEKRKKEAEKAATEAETAKARADAPATDASPDAVTPGPSEAGGSAAPVSDATLGFRERAGAPGFAVCRSRPTEAGPVSGGRMRLSRLRAALWPKQWSAPGPKPLPASKQAIPQPPTTAAKHERVG